MAAKRGFIQATRRPGVLAVHSLDHFTFGVPDLDVARNFYTKFGLDVRESGDRLDLHTFGHPHRWMSITEGSRKAMSYLSFGVFADDVEAFRAHLDQNHVQRLDPPPGFGSNGLWFRGCNGVLIELKAAEKTSPNEKPIYPPVPPVNGAQAVCFKTEVPPVRPLRLAHVMVFVRDLAESVAFYSRVLGLRLSDEVGGAIAFMHGAHGSDHHTIAFGKSNAPGLHHCSWDVGHVNEVGQGAMQMANSGFPEGWGLGRFVCGSNYFHYVRDPWGSYSEYVSDVDYIPVNMEYEGQTHTPQEASYLWRPKMPPDFTFNYEAAAAT